MKQTFAKWVILAGGAVLLAGCEGTTTKVQVQPPAAVPAPASAYTREPLPLPERPASPVSLRLDPRPAIDVLVAQVQERFSAGQREFKSGNIDKGRAELDKAINLILISGFQAESDPRLSKLFDQIGEAMHAYPAATGQGRKRKRRPRMRRRLLPLSRRRSTKSPT